MLEAVSAILPAFILSCVLIEITPGPNMAYLAVLVVSEGRRVGYAAVAGVALGLLIVGLLAALGLAALISASPFLFQTLRWGGVVYLLWLAWDTWTGEGKGTNEFADSNRWFFRRGLIVNLLNPKAGVFYVAMLPQFVNPDAPILGQTVILSVTFVLIATLIHGAIVTAAGALRPFLTQTGKRDVVRRVLAVALVVVAIWLAFKTQS